MSLSVNTMLDGLFACPDLHCNTQFLFCVRLQNNEKVTLNHIIGMLSKAHCNSPRGTVVKHYGYMNVG